MRALLHSLFLLAAACLAAGLYGALHNQVSYTVSPDYFHAFKFRQFSIADGLQNRLGASWVGWQASWWMGLVIGVPILLVTRFAPGRSHRNSLFVRAAVIVVFTALVIGAGGLFRALFFVDQGHLPVWVFAFTPDDPVAMARAGELHNATYLGGLVGLACALVYAASVVRRLRRNHRNDGAHREADLGSAEIR
ncbi:MAG: hypothetical protein AAFQ84_12885 [Pseudomonadota bacterium]